MSRPRFLADHDFNEYILDALLRREPAIEITRAREVNLHEAADDVVLEFASKRSLLVLSHDVNTMPAAAYTRIAEGKEVAGLLMAKQTLSRSRVIDSLLLIWSASEAEEYRDQVWFLPV